MMIIDFHSHILPNVDDGSRSAEQSYKMLADSAEQGIDVIIATPHFLPDHDSPKRFLARRDEALERISGRPERPKILLGAEVAYFPGISQSREICDLRIEGSSLLLLELPFSNWSNRMVTEVCDIYGALHLTPVLAHYERYANIPGSARAIDHMRRSGCLLQSNAEAFLATGYRRRKALKAFQSGAISFLGSDCHNDSSRKPNLGEALQFLSAKAGARALEEFHNNARQLLFGE